jgi:hypothetical protein
MGTTRFRGHVKNWNQKYTPSPIQPCDTHNNFLKLSQAFRGLLWALQKPFIFTVPKHPRRDSVSSRTLSDATSSANPRVTKSFLLFNPHNTLLEASETRHSKTFRERSRRERLRCGCGDTRLSPRLNVPHASAPLPYATTCSEHLPCLVYSSPSRCAGKLAEANVSLTVAVRNVRYRLRRKKQLGNARQYQNMGFGVMSTTTCWLDVESGVLSHRVTSDSRSSGRW